MLTISRFLRIVIAGALALVASIPPSFAQTSGGTGAIVGRVFNPTTQEYVRNAELSITNTG